MSQRELQSRAARIIMPTEIIRSFVIIEPSVDIGPDSMITAIKKLNIKLSVSVVKIELYVMV